MNRQPCSACPACGRVYTIRQDGRLRQHQGCGSGMAVAAVAGAGQVRVGDEVWVFAWAPGRPPALCTVTWVGRVRSKIRVGGRDEAFQLGSDQRAHQHPRAWWRTLRQLDAERRDSEVRSALEAGGIVFTRHAPAYSVDVLEAILKAIGGES